MCLAETLSLHDKYNVACLHLLTKELVSRLLFCFILQLVRNMLALSGIGGVGVLLGFSYVLAAKHLQLQP